MTAFSLGGCQLGVATSATQIEGGDNDTNWHRWARIGRIRDGSTPARASGHAGHVAEDTALLQSLGIRHYRMGIEWARVEPRPAMFDAAAIDAYREELTRLRQAGITPLVTLHHFTNPMWFEDAGGFLNPRAIPIFLRYVQRMVNELSDLVDEWITINEPNVYGANSYLYGEWPPGRKSVRETLAVYGGMAHAHVEAYQLIHALQPSARVGVANHLRIFVPRRTWNPYHRTLAKGIQYLFQGALTRAMSRGRFLAPLVQPKGVRPGRYYDFQGINYYSRSTISGPRDGVADDVPVNDLGWEIHPQGLVDLAAQVNAAYPGPIYITENGTCDNTDSFRSLFIYEHLHAIATSGLPVERFYHWCFTDNWEWLEGESARFGLVHVDYETQERTVKDSGRFFADIIANAGVTPQAYRRYVAHQTYRTNGPPR